MTHAPLTIRPLSPELHDDFLRFFEGEAFADNPRWATCYCQYPHVDHSRVAWHDRTGEENRAAACGRIESGRMQGLLAYRGHEVVGWCNCAPRILLEAFASEPDPDADRLGHIACFVVAKAHRRAGVARALLGAACEMLRREGVEIVEACPSRSAATDAENHFGPLSLYLSAGFGVHREEDDGRVIVRRRLDPPAA